MLSRSERQRLDDIREYILLARSFASKMTAEHFAADPRTFLAVTRCLEIISEASRHLSPELKGRYPALPWGRIAGAGNIYRHGYELVDAATVWNTLQNALPPLLAMLEAELGPES